MLTDDCLDDFFDDLLEELEDFLEDFFDDLPESPGDFSEELLDELDDELSLSLDELQSICSSTSSIADVLGS